MATRLYRLGGWAFEHRWRVVAIWVTVLVAVFASAAAFGGKTNDKFSVPGTESQQAQELLEQKYPAASGTYARLVFAAPEGEKLTDAENKAAVEASLAKASQAQDVSGVTSPYETKAITQDGRVGFADVIYPVPADKIDDQARDELEASATPAEEAGLQTEFGGGLVTDESHANSESLGMMVGFLVLAITLGSLLAAGLPLLTAIIGVGIGLVGLQALTDVIEVSETAPILATMLGLAVGIDYALFILTRYRSNLAGRHGRARRRRACDGHRRQRRRVRRRDRRDRPGRPARRQHPVPDRDGHGGGRHRVDRRADRPHAAARDLRLRRASRGTRQPLRQLAAAAPCRGRGHHEHPLGEVRHPPPVGRGRRVRRPARRDRRPGDAHGARPAGRRLGPGRLDRRGRRTTCSRRASAPASTVR